MNALPISLGPPLNSKKSAKFRYIPLFVNCQSAAKISCSLRIYQTLLLSVVCYRFIRIVESCEILDLPDLRTHWFCTPHIQKSKQLQKTEIEKKILPISEKPKFY